MNTLAAMFLCASPQGGAAACSEELDASAGPDSCDRQGVLEGSSETWAQGVGARRMLQRYVGEPHNGLAHYMHILQVAHASAW